jgi:hypothetical protein
MADARLTLLVPAQLMPVGALEITPAVRLQLGAALRGETGAAGTSPPQLLFVQADEPASASPFIWFKTDPLDGRVLDILKG